MKFVRFSSQDRVAYGLWEGDIIREISGSIFGKFQETSRQFKISGVRLLAPVEPTKILCVGLNYRAHIEELGRALPELPAHFIKPLTCLIGPDDPIIYPRIGKFVSYEGELAVVIKDAIKDISQAEALKHVLGYTCFNDVTERTFADLPGQLTRAKGFDTFGPCGPCIVTDLDPANTNVQTYLNGKLMQDGNTRDLVFPVSFLIHYLSQCMTLLPGDIISTGTPRGIHPMNPGDVVEVRVEGIGTLRNTVQALR